MKFYIPTTSMNFNCVLSSESVSPVGFYQARGFGYSRWFTVPENDQEGAVLLYSKPFSFKRPQSDQEDHPMMIEIDSNEKFQEIAEGVFACDHTIYLNSLADKIILFSENDKNAVLSLSDSSLETKMVRFYRKRIVVCGFEGEAPDISKIARIPLNHSAVEHDRRINKFKGLLYGYYIGAMLSADSTDVLKLNTLREVQNIFSAAISSERRCPTEAQANRLMELFSLLRKGDPFFDELTKIVGDEHKADSIIALARKYGHQLVPFDEERLVRELAIAATENPSQRWVKSMIDSLNRAMLAKRRRLSVGSDEIVVESATLLRISDKVLPDLQDNRLFMAWVNDVLLQQRFNGKISTIKDTLSDELTVKAKAVLGDEWKDGSAIKAFMNDLRRHVRGAGFDHTWNNGLLSSMAAVVVKGDNWEKLLSFMQSVGMTDYRLAFAFYGMLNGFANLTRDFTDILLNQDAQYLIEVYREFYGELHGIRVEVPMTDPAVKELDTTSNRGNKDTDDIPRKTLFQRVISLFDTKEFQKRLKRKEELRKGLNQAFEKLGGQQDAPLFLRLLSEFKGLGWDKDNMAWKRLRDALAPEFSLETTKKPRKGSRAHEKATEQAAQQLPGFEEPQSDHMDLLSGAWVGECASLIVDPLAKKTFVKDLTWFVNNHHKTYQDWDGSIVQGRYYGRYILDLESIERHMMEQGRGSKNESIRADYQKVPVDDIMAFLRKRYGKR